MQFLAFIPVLILFAAVPIGFKYWRKRMALKTFEPLAPGSQPKVDIELENGSHIKLQLFTDDAPNLQL